MAKKPPVKQRQLKRALEILKKDGVAPFDRKELKQLGLPIIREARKRVRQLEQAGFTDSAAYREYINEKKMKMTTAGKNLNTIRHEIFEAITFLNAFTSTIEGARQHREWLNAKLGKETTTEERERIWDVVHHFENKYTGHFTAFGYDESIRKIAQITKASKYNLYEQLRAEALEPDAERPITDKVNAYLLYEGEVSIDTLEDFLKSEAKTIEDMLRIKSKEEEKSVWYRREDFSKEF